MLNTRCTFAKASPRHIFGPAHIINHTRFIYQTIGGLGTRERLLLASVYNSVSRANVWFGQQLPLTAATQTRMADRQTHIALTLTHTHCIYIAACITNNLSQITYIWKRGRRVGGWVRVACRRHTLSSLACITLPFNESQTGRELYGSLRLKCSMGGERAHNASLNEKIKD